MTARVHALLLVVFATTHATLVEEAVSVIKLGIQIGQEVYDSWEDIKNPLNAHAMLTNHSIGIHIYGQDMQVLEKLAQIARTINRMELNIARNSALSMLLARSRIYGTRLEPRLRMADLLSRITSADRQMREYARYQSTLERSTLEDFARGCVSHDSGALPDLLERVYSMVVPPHENLLGKGILQLILEDLKDENLDTCEMQMSAHQLIYDMYNSISLTEIKGYAMMQFSWMLLRLYGKGNYAQEANLSRLRYEERTARIAASAKATLAVAKRDLYRCDPPEHKLGETYDEVTRLLQGYVENEVDMSPGGTCWQDCEYYTVGKNRGCYMEQFCARQPACRGRITNCRFIDSNMWICLAGRKSHRRYEWIKYQNGITLGPYGNCKGTGVSKAESWRRWLFWQCSYCICLCDEAGPDSHRYFSLWESTSDVENNKPNTGYAHDCLCLCEDNTELTHRYINLEEVLSDTKKNKVVTGLRFKKVGRIFHLQISEGTLGERGSITPGRWLPIRNFDISTPGIQDGVDYHKLTYERRAIDLDELDSPEGHILTGVRFRMVGAHLHFEIRSTPFNYTTGRLSPEKSQWISNDNTEDAQTPRSRLNLVQPDIPTRNTIPLRIDSKHNQYLEFVNSDFDMDAAQSTVPFIDIQPLQPMKGTALLSGAGIIHRGGPGSGGFVAAKLFTYDYSRHMVAPTPTDAIKNYDNDYGEL